MSLHGVKTRGKALSQPASTRGVSAALSVTKTVSHLGGALGRKDTQSPPLSRETCCKTAVGAWHHGRHQRLRAPCPLHVRVRDPVQSTDGAAGETGNNKRE